MFIDIFTRYLFTYPLKTLTGVEMVGVMQEIIGKQETKPKILRTDQGSEYKNKEVERYLSQEKLNMSLLITKQKQTMQRELLKQ